MFAFLSTWQSPASSLVDREELSPMFLKGTAYTGGCTNQEGTEPVRIGPPGVLTREPNLLRTQLLVNYGTGLINLYSLLSRALLQ